MRISMSQVPLSFPSILDLSLYHVAITCIQSTIQFLSKQFYPCEAIMIASLQSQTENGQRKSGEQKR